VSVPDLSAIKARLLPRLDDPYFTRANEHVGRGCDHVNAGMTLDHKSRTVACACGTVLDPFDALVLYARSEDRLVSTLGEMRKRDARLAEEKQREKARRPFARAVVGRAAIKDETLKAEPTTGYALTLECGHAARCGPERVPKRVTCRTCQAAGRAAASPGP